MDLAEVRRLTGEGDAVQAARDALDALSLGLDSEVWHYIGFPDGELLEGSEAIPTGLPLGEDDWKRAFLTMGLSFGLALEGDTEAADASLQEALNLAEVRPVVCAAANQIDALLVRRVGSGEATVWLEGVRERLVQGRACPW